MNPSDWLRCCLGLCGAAMAVFGLVNAGLAIRRVSQAVETWTDGARPMEATAPVPVLRMSRSVPAMIAAGILRPKVFMSGAAEFVLTANELQSRAETMKWPTFAAATI